MSGLCPEAAISAQAQDVTQYHSRTYAGLSVKQSIPQLDLCRCRRGFGEVYAP